jgi:hypothetical protein
LGIIEVPEALKAITLELFREMICRRLEDIPDPFYFIYEQQPLPRQQEHTFRLSKLTGSRGRTVTLLGEMRPQAAIVAQDGPAIVAAAAAAFDKALDSTPAGIGAGGPRGSGIALRLAAFQQVNGRILGQAAPKHQAPRRPSNNVGATSSGAMASRASVSIVTTNTGTTTTTGSGGPRRSTIAVASTGPGAALTPAAPKRIAPSRPSVIGIAAPSPSSPHLTGKISATPPSPSTLTSTTTTTVTIGPIQAPSPTAASITSRASIAAPKRVAPSRPSVMGMSPSITITTTPTPPSPLVTPTTPTVTPPPLTRPSSVSVSTTTPTAPVTPRSETVTTPTVTVVDKVDITSPASPSPSVTAAADITVVVKSTPSSDDTKTTTTTTTTDPTPVTPREVISIPSSESTTTAPITVPISTVTPTEVVAPVDASPVHVVSTPTTPSVTSDIIPPVSEPEPTPVVTSPPTTTPNEDIKTEPTPIPPPSTVTTATTTETTILSTPSPVVPPTATVDASPSPSSPAAASVAVTVNVTEPGVSVVITSNNVSSLPSIREAPSSLHDKLDESPLSSATSSVVDPNELSADHDSDSTAAMSADEISVTDADVVSFDDGMSVDGDYVDDDPLPPPVRVEVPSNLLLPDLVPMEPISMPFGITFATYHVNEGAVLMEDVHVPTDTVATVATTTTTTVSDTTKRESTIEIDPQLAAAALDHVNRRQSGAGGAPITEVSDVQLDEPVDAIEAARLSVLGRPSKLPLSILSGGIRTAALSVASPPSSSPTIPSTSKSIAATAETSSNTETTTNVASPRRDSTVVQITALPSSVPVSPGTPLVVQQVHLGREHRAVVMNEQSHQHFTPTVMHIQSKNDTPTTATTATTTTTTPTTTGGNGSNASPEASDSEDDITLGAPLTPPITLAKLAAAAAAKSPTTLHLSRKPKEKVHDSPSAPTADVPIVKATDTTPATTTSTTETTAATTISPKLRPAKPGADAVAAALLATESDEVRHRRQSSLPVAAGVGPQRRKAKKAAVDAIDEWGEGYPSSFTRDRSIIPARPLPAPNVVIEPGVAYVPRRRFSTNSTPYDLGRRKAMPPPQPLPLPGLRAPKESKSPSIGILTRSVTALPGASMSSGPNGTPPQTPTSTMASVSISTISIGNESKLMMSSITSSSALPGMIVPVKKGAPGTTSASSSSSSPTGMAVGTRDRKKSEIAAPDWGRLDMNGSLNWLLVSAHFFTYVQTAIRPHALQSLLGGGSIKAWLAISASSGLHYRGKSTTVVDKAMHDVCCSHSLPLVI